MMSLKGKIESILFLTDKPVKAQVIAKLTGEDVQLVRQSLLELIHDYEERDGGLEIADEEGYVLRVKDEYSNIMEEFMPLEMSAAVLRTLSAITIKQPISQSEIIQIRGGGAYEHIKDLVHRGLVNKRDDEKGRSPILSTTKKFQEYFRLTKDGKSLRQYLRKQMKKKDKDDAVPDTSFDASPDNMQQPGLGAEDLASAVMNEIIPGAVGDESQAGFTIDASVDAVAEPAVAEMSGSSAAVGSEVG